MTIDIKRLETDLDYWNEVAPDGATHYDANDGSPDCPWMRFSSEYGWEAWNGDRKYWIDDVSGDDYAAAYIPRPAPSWGGRGLPPVGTFCEFDKNNEDFLDCPSSGWLETDLLEVVAHKSGEVAPVAVVWNLRTREAHSLIARHFCPIRTKKERVVEAALSLDEYPRGQSAGGMMSRKDFCEKLYDAGMLKEATND